MFGFGEAPKKKRGEVGDDQLIQAVRKRLLRDIAEKHEAQHISNVINNHQGGGHGGLMEAMNGGQHEDPALFDYMVDIEKHDIPGAEGGKPVGWKKSVHRHRSPKGLAGE